MMKRINTPPRVFVDKRGICESRSVGPGTRIWAFAHVLAGARIGRDCNICDHVFIENDVILGDEVTVKSGVQLWDGVRVGNRVFVGPNATFTNDGFPQSKLPLERFVQTVVEDDASIGANATILPGVRIGRAAMVGAGAVVTKDVPAYAVVIGNPAVITGYQAERSAREIGKRISTDSLGEDAGSRMPLGVGECALRRMRHFSDMRGSLVPIEFVRDLPFIPNRAFVVYDVPSHYVRGEHAHRACSQLLVAIHGQFAVVIDDGRNRCEVPLEHPTIGLYLPPMIWATQYKFDRSTILLTFASDPYDPADYIRNYESFRMAVDTGD
jgi:UDP-2-acetamido-3-amino-2,3-dideoxy-glucuronate N-acetyltransferase